MTPSADPNRLNRSSWRVFWLCLKGVLKTPADLFRYAWVPMVMSAIIFLAMFTAIHIANIKDQVSQEKPGRFSVGYAIARAAAEKLMAFSGGKSASAEKSGALVFVDAPALQKAAIEEPLVSHGFGLASTPESADVLLKWDGANWHLSSLKEGQALLAFVEVSKAVAAQASVPLPKLFNAFHDQNPTVKPSKRSFGDIMTWLAVVLGVVFPLSGLLMLVSLSTAKTMESARGEGELEAFALTPSPFWCYLLAFCVAQGVQYAGLVGALTLVAGAFVGFMPFVAWACLVLAAGILASVVAMLGCSTVFCWHHMHSRIAGSVLIAPLIMVIMSYWMFFVWFEKNAPDSPYNTDTSIRLPLLSTPPDQAALFLLITAVAGGLFLWGACRLLEWRLGPRRTGLGMI